MMIALFAIIAYLPQLGDDLQAQEDSPIPTPTFTPSITPTPSLTPTESIRNIIYEPTYGDAISGFTAIRGTALINAYRKYELHISVAGQESWQWLTTSYEVVKRGELYRLDSTDFPDGYYDFRVRAIQDNGSYSETFVRNVEIRNANPPTLTPVYNDAGTPEPIPTNTPTATLSPTPTPTPYSENHFPNGQGFYSPQNDEIVRGYLPITGVVNGFDEQRFLRADIAISPTGLEEANTVTSESGVTETLLHDTEIWSWLYSTTDQIWHDTIYILNTARFADGLYDIRMRIVFEDSNYHTFYIRRLHIANEPNLYNRLVRERIASLPPTPYVPPKGFFYPQSNTSVRGTVAFGGAAVHEEFLRWELHWARSDGSSDWAFLFSSDKPVVNGLFARLDFTQLPEGRYDFRLRVVREDTNYDEYFVRNIYNLGPMIR
ncbi:MAG: hypothetical protein AAF639_31860 [Chloroflexota bacterium]